MFDEWCEVCQQPRKCHNVDGELYCIACKQFVTTV